MTAWNIELVLTRHYQAPRPSHNIGDTWLKSNFYEENLESLLDYTLSMSQQCVALENKNNIVKLFTGMFPQMTKILDRSIPNSLVYSTGHTTFGRQNSWSEMCSVDHKEGKVPGCQVTAGTQNWKCLVQIKEYLH